MKQKKVQKQERTISQQVASAHATLFVLLAVICFLGSDTHWVFPILGVFCLWVAFEYDKIAHNKTDNNG